MTEFVKRGNLAVDSMSVRIPIADVEILDSQLKQWTVTVLKETGEVIAENQIKHRAANDKGVNFTCRIERLQHGNKGQPGTFLIIAVHSKLLGKDYLQGMTAANIQQLHERLLSFGVVYFPLEVFAAASCTDVDIKQDFIGAASCVKQMNSELHEMYIPRKDKKAGSQQHFGKALNGQKIYTGHSFNDRKCVSFLTCPYMKIYSKNADAESIEHSEFFVLNDIHLPTNLWRQEFTLKGKKHMQLFEIENTVAGILSADQQKLKSAQQHVMSALFMPRKKSHTKINEAEYSPRDIADICFIKCILENAVPKMTSQQIFDYVTADMDRVNKSKYKARFQQLFEAALKGTKIYQNDKMRTSFFDVLGIC